MASTPSENGKLIKRVNFAYLHRLFAGVALIGFFVVCLAGVLNSVSMITIMLNSTAVMVVVKVVSWIVIKILASYEEMNSGQA